LGFEFSFFVLFHILFLDVTLGRRGGGATRKQGDRLLPVKRELTGPPTLITSELGFRVLLLSNCPDQFWDKKRQMQTKAKGQVSVLL
jgi:hypothetical protein